MAGVGKEITYVGNADVRSFTKEDFERHDISNQKDVTFNEENDWTEKVSADAWRFISSPESGLADEFSLSSEVELVDEEPVEEPVT